MSKQSKLSIVLALIIVFGLTSIYTFIPGTLSVSGKEYAHAIDQSIYTTLKRLKHSANESPAQLPTPLQNASFKITELTYPQFNLQSFQQEGRGTLEIIPTQNIDSTIIQWQWTVSSGYNPISRIRALLNWQQIKDSMSSYAKNLALYVSQTQNTYGLNIETTDIKDTLIASLSNEFEFTPTPEMICQLEERLQHELQRNSIKNTGTIMLLQRYSEGKHKAMVGVPVIERPSPSSVLMTKKINPSKLVSGIVQGGPASIQAGYSNIKKYIMDRNIEEAAMPYEILLTNRCAEKDTSKWRTKICYPVY